LSENEGIGSLTVQRVVNEIQIQTNVNVNQTQI
jgi:hypothetical protein